MKIVLLLLFSVFSAFSQQIADHTGGAESAYDSSETYSPEEYQTSLNYEHGARAARIADVDCSQASFKDLCSNSTTAFRGEAAQTVEQMEGALSSILALINPMLKIKSKSGDDAVDYCAIISSAATLGANAFVQLKGDSAIANLKSAEKKSQQAEAFYTTADLQKNANVASLIKGSGWSASAACYAIRAASGEVALNPGLITKLALSTAMGSLYYIKAGLHGKRQKEILKIAEKLPKIGECNPVTQRSCFCNEPTSRTADPTNFQKYCIVDNSRLYAENQTVCITASGLADPNCNCRLSNSCITHRFAGLQGELNLTDNQMQNLLTRLSPFQLGYSKGSLATDSGSNFAFAKKALEQISPKVPTTPKKLSSSQNDFIAQLGKLGVPKRVAALTAQSIGEKAIAQALDTKSSAPVIAKKSSKKTQTQFKSGSVVRSKIKSRPKNPYLRAQRREASAEAIEINNDYASLVEQAQRKAEITKDVSKPLFEIISYRYKKSAWNAVKEAQ